jgi:hypothetical protein
MKKGNFVFAQGNGNGSEGHAQFFHKTTFNPSDPNRPEVQKIKVVQEQQAKPVQKPGMPQQPQQGDSGLGFLKVEKSPVEIKKPKVDV